MNVKLKEITLKNFRSITELKVAENQNFVASNAFSIAESKYDLDENVSAIYDDDIPIGFAMYCFEYEENTLWISRFMIDKKYQGKGYGKAAMSLIIELARKDKEIFKVGLSTSKENIAGIAFYTMLGFVDTNKVQVFGKSKYEIYELDLLKS
jgi:diamine N-acetyltransferase